MKKALLFVNGEPPKDFALKLTQYDYIACTDGAYHNYLIQTEIVPHFIIGDLDSVDNRVINPGIDIIHTPDQSKTDFEKSLLFLADKGVKIFDIYGATGFASDHFLGNLSVAKQYYQQYQLTFYDNYCYFQFAKQQMTFKNVKNRTISLIPLNNVKQLTLTGFEYPLNNADLQFGGLISIRNKAINDNISLTFADGELLIFISHI